MLSLFQFREKRIEQEKELLQKQNTWLGDELKTKTDELIKLRKEKVLVKRFQCTCVHYFKTACSITTRLLVLLQENFPCVLLLPLVTCIKKNSSQNQSIRMWSNLSQSRNFSTSGSVIKLLRSQLHKESGQS